MSIRRFLDRITSAKRFSSRRPNPLRARRSQLRFEPLEQRQLLSVSPAGFQSHEYSDIKDVPDDKVGLWIADQIVARGSEGSSVNLDERAMESIRAITRTGTDEKVFTTQTSESLDLIDVDDFQADERFDEVTGSGYSVVVLDSGLDVDHLFFGQDLDLDGVADRLVYQYDFVNEDNDISTTHRHGSNVTGIIASEDDIYPGVAPDVDIIHLKVLDDSGNGTWEDTEDALQWVVANAATYNVAAVNMSLGDGSNSPREVTAYLSDELASLVEMDIMVVSASGNSFVSYYWNSIPGVGYPSSDPNSLSIGAVYDDDVGEVDNFSWSGTIDYTTAAGRIAAFSQRHGRLTTVMAPGSHITSASVNNGTVTYRGTSQAAPHVTGMAVLAQELAVKTLGGRLPQEQFATMLRDTGTTINDGDDEDDNVTNTNLDFKLANMFNLAEAIKDLPIVVDADSAGTGASDDDNADTFLVERGSGDNLDIYVNGTLFKTVRAHWRRTITINGSSDDDTVTIKDLGPEFNGTLTVNAGTGTDTAYIYDSMDPLVETDMTVSGYHKGITGVVIEVDIPLGAIIDTSDFQFRVYEDESWITGPEPDNLTIHHGAGTGYTDHIAFSWDDDSIVDQWLEVTALLSSDLDLPLWDEKFYFGSLRGDTDSDGDVDGDDYDNFNSGWFGPDGADPQNPSPPASLATGDFDLDGDVDFDDWVTFSINYNGDPLPDHQLTGTAQKTEGYLYYRYTGDDTFTAAPGKAYMDFGSDGVIGVTANDFDTVTAYSDSVGTDTAVLYDSMEPILETGMTVSGYYKGIIGTVLEADIPVGAVIDDSDFQFQVYEGSSWTTGPTPENVIVLPGEGAGGTDQIVFSWNDGSIVDKWLEITVLASGDVGVASDETLYFGSLRGNTDSDRDVDFNDYVDFSSGWFGPDGADPQNPSPPASLATGDFDIDGDVDFGDWVTFSINYFGDTLPDHGLTGSTVINGYLYHRFLYADDDTFAASPGSASMDFGSDASLNIQLGGFYGFDIVKAYSLSGTDTADFDDSSDDDTFTIDIDEATMDYGSDQTVNVVARAFDDVYADFSTGGDDTCDITGSTGDDSLSTTSSTLTVDFDNAIFALDLILSGLGVGDTVNADGNGGDDDEDSGTELFDLYLTDWS